ncbi:expressed unknown protein [Seminavis robusta]|uniref:VWFD domain-containing protein n=1 Tax=Seminavis robusta TaxID=568900 RepID=A0A9N8DBV3_9STRA|nr:expressed unknown protein [Seminavis robusta]|eukprot:Sro77_g041850.1 n/a (338) ;mRNA; r:3793-4920
MKFSILLTLMAFLSQASAEEPTPGGLQLDPSKLNDLIADKTAQPPASQDKPIDDTGTLKDQVLDVLNKGKVNEKNSAATQGDPHFLMWNGRRYDFHGGCDLVFLDNPDYNHGQGLRIVIRTKIVHWWSYVQTAVVQIGNDTLEVKGGVAHKEYYVNGKPGPHEEHSKAMPFTIAGHKVRFRVKSKTQFQFKIFLEDDQNIVIRSVKDFLKVDVQNHKKATFGTSRGLLGSYEDGLMLARDGATILEDANEFGQEWQVRSDEPMLFHSVEGVQHPQACTIPNAEQKDQRRRLIEEAVLISYDEAAKACMTEAGTDLIECINDVMITGDADMAGAYSDE